MNGDAGPDRAPSRALVTAVVVLLLLLAGCSGAPIGPNDGNGGANTTNGSDETPSETDRSARSGPPRTLVGVQSDSKGWTNTGAVYMFNGKNVEWHQRDGAIYFEATELDNGSVVAAFADSGYQEGCGRYSPPCAKTGFKIIDPKPQPHIVHEWSFPIRNVHNSEVHDVEALPGGGFVVTDMEYERVFVWKNGEIVWQWNASEYYDPPEDATTVDWLHINDVDRIGQGRYLVSVRNANQLLVVERGQGVVEVINEDKDNSDDESCTKEGQLQDTDGDGDVNCGDPSVLDHQHNPQWLGDGVVLVADSHNDRVVELVRNEDGDWEAGWSLESAAGKQFHWPRDADRLPNGNTLITDSRNNRVLEVTKDGKVVWMAEHEYIPYEADRLPHGETVGGEPYSETKNESG